MSFLGINMVKRFLLLLVAEVLKHRRQAGRTRSETAPNSPSDFGNHMLKSHTLKSKVNSAKSLSEAGGSVSSRPA